MKVEIKVPQMGESITEASVGAILINSGSPVKADDEILELETEKVNQVLYAPESGTLHLSVKSDETVKIGEVIGFVDTEGKAEAKEEKPVPKEARGEPGKSVSEKSKGVRESKEKYLEKVLSQEKRTKPQEEKVLKREAKESLAPVPTEKGERRETRRRMTKIRRVIARRLVEVQNETAMLTTFNEIDMSVVMELRSKYKDKFLNDYGVKLGFMSFFVKACAFALQEFPGINSYIDGDEIVHREYYDIGIAVSSERGLVVPVLRDCDNLSFAEIEKGIADFAVKARSGGLSVDDLEGGGFTITNGGVFGSLLSTPILNPPQSGILGMHKIDKRAVVVNDEIVIRPMMYVALSYDHRIVDGKEAVTFLVRIKNILEDPSRLILDV